jgi:predicted ATPase
MITKIEINGFKTFENFELDLSPFVIIAGSNGSGKSNLFDAIRLLSSLAEKDLKTAFGEQRGSFSELFTLYSNSNRAEKMRFAVELFLDKVVKDPFNKEETLGHRRLRYELHISRRKDDKFGFERLFVDFEVLRPIKKGNDKWVKTFVNNNTEWESDKVSHNYKAYINTETRDEIRVISIRQDGIRGGKPTPVKDLERSVLSGVNDASFPHAFAVREEMLNWRQFQFSPIELSKPSSMLGKDILDNEGRYLAGMLKRIEVTEKPLIRSISRNIQNILPDIKRIFIDEDQARQQYVLMVEASDNRIFSANVLSEGTLRIIALSALKYDDRYKGLVCFEEPENGIHPFRMKKILDLLKDLSTDFNLEGEAEFSLRQVIINTHSPSLITEFFENLKSYKGILYYSRLLSKVDSEKHATYKITKLSPVKYGNSMNIFLKSTPAEVKLTHHEVIEYLKTDDAEESTIQELMKI